MRTEYLSTVDNNHSKTAMASLISLAVPRSLLLNTVQLRMTLHSSSGMF